MIRRLAVTLAGVGLCLFWASPTAAALPGPGPICPGDGQDVNVLGVDAGHCDFMFTPDGIHVHCEWGGYGMPLWQVADATNCWRVDANGDRLPPPPLHREDH